jgi:hypothetical protein
MANELFSLPSSSISELIKIIVGYSNAGEQASLDDISKLIGMNRTSISGNNQFLMELGLIEGGKSKQITGLGVKLGRALEHHQEEDVRQYLSQVVSENDFLSKLVTTLRIKKEMSIDDFLRHIVYASGQSDNSKNRTGSRSVLDILLMSGAVKEIDGQLEVTVGTQQSSAATQKIEANIVEAQLPETKGSSLEMDLQDKKINFQPSPTKTINLI